jgi:predicted metal-binding protein
MKKHQHPVPVDVRKAAWTAVVLVCRDCRKRSSGPEDIKLKAALHEARRALKQSGARGRVVSSSCLGLCPKRALAVAWAGAHGAPTIAAVEHVEQVGASVAALAETALRG